MLKKPKRFVFYSSHDYNMVLLLNSLGHHTDKRPSYASTVLFELVKHKKERQDDKFSVKVLFNDRPVVIPECGEELCELGLFKKAMESRIVAKDIRAYCYSHDGNIQ